MIIELNNITKSYFNSESSANNNVLVDISFALKFGEAMSIIGPSGCGKSTLLNIIGTIDIPTSGSVKFDNIEINKLTPDQLATIRNRDIGFVFQSHHLFPQLSVLDNVLIPTIPIKDRKYKSEAAERARILLHKVGLSKNLQQLPSQLSGGECQRVAVVRALINMPKLILADEPTGSLDEKSAEAIGELLSAINKEENVAMIVVTHSLKLAKTIGNNYNLSGGKIRQDNQ